MREVGVFLIHPRLAQVGGRQGKYYDTVTSLLRQQTGQTLRLIVSLAEHEGCRL